MLLIHPSSLYARAHIIDPSSVWKSAAGWTRGIAIPIILAGSQTEEEVPDGFIQKGKGYGRHPVYHCKLPPVKVYTSQASMEFWAKQNDLWTRYDIKDVSSLFTPMYQSASNGIHTAYCFKAWYGGDTVYFAVCSPARGIRSNYWTIGTIYYYAWEVSNPGTLYPTRGSQYSLAVSDKFPWLSDSSYDPSYAEMCMIANFDTSKFKQWSQYHRATFPLKAYEEYSQPNFYRNLFREDSRINGLPVSDHQYEYDWLVQHAFYEACQGIGRINENSIQNIVQIITDVAGICSSLGMGGVKIAEKSAKAAKQSIKTRLKDKARMVASHEVVQVAENASSAWLGYRYSYTTTMMDYKQFVDYINHKADVWFDFLNKNYHEELFGSADYNIDGISVKCICQLAYRPRAYEGLKSMCRYIHDAGLEVNPYVLWDFIPFSFIVDWGVPLGDVFEVISDQKYYSESYYDFEYVGFSLKYYIGEEGSRYYRWYQSPPPLESEYWFDKGDKKPSGKLKLKRAADIISLIVG